MTNCTEYKLYINKSDLLKNNSETWVLLTTKLKRIYIYSSYIEIYIFVINIDWGSVKTGWNIKNLPMGDFWSPKFHSCVLGIFPAIVQESWSNRESVI